MQESIISISELANTLECRGLLVRCEDFAKEHIDLMASSEEASPHYLPPLLVLSDKLGWSSLRDSLADHFVANHTDFSSTVEKGSAMLAKLKPETAYRILLGRIDKTSKWEFFFAVLIAAPVVLRALSHA